MAAQYRLFLALWFSLSAPSLAFSACRSAQTEADVQAALNQQPRSVLFFASWCRACAAHFRELKPEQVVVIGTLDEKSAIEAVLEKLKWSGPCLFDEQGRLRRLFQVEGVPRLFTPDEATRVLGPHHAT